MNVEKGLKKFLKDWAVMMYGESEGENPSWSIEDLAHSLKEEFDKINYKIETLNLKTDVQMVAEDNDVRLTDEQLDWVVDEYRTSEAYCELNRPAIEYFIERATGGND